MVRRFMRCCSVVFTIMCSAVVVSCGQTTDSMPAPPVPDLSDHSLYSTYDFGSAVKVIDMGVQPLWLPTSIITEAMRRDAVLTEQLTELGLAIRFHPFLKGADVNFFLERGDLEVGIGGDMPTLTAAARSNVLVASLTQQGYCSIVARRHMLLKELRGKRIGYAFGSNAHYALLDALSLAGLAETDVRLIPVDVNEMPDALNQDTIDAFSAWEPTPTVALARFEDQVVIHRSLSTGYLYFSRAFAEGNPEGVHLVVASELRAVYWLNERRENLLQAARWALEEGRKLSPEVGVLSENDYAFLAERDLLGFLSVALLPENVLSKEGPLFREFEFLRRLGRISDAATWEGVRSCFDQSIIEQVLTEKQKYKVDTFRYQEGDFEP